MLTGASCFAQDTVLNKYGLWVIGERAVLQQMITRDPAKKMVDLNKLLPGIQLDLRYSTKDNFTQVVLYPFAPTTYLRRQAAEGLARVYNILETKGLDIKVWDAYRPFSVTDKMWELIKDDRYVADPKHGIGHNRGIAVDLTLTDAVTGKELDMGTGFDNFTDTAHHGFKQLPLQVLANRLLLKTLMEQAGFIAFDTEWWHYSLPNGKEYELLDLSFDDLRRLN